MEIKIWDIISRQTVFQKYGRKVDEIIFKLPNGKEADFYIKNEADTVCILALTEDKRVILVQQFRPGPLEVLLELPGGDIEEGEALEEAGARELLEETGYAAGKTELVVKALDCAYSTRWRYCLVATGCKKVAEPQNTDTEIVSVELMSLNDFREHLRSGKLTDIEVGYLGLDYLGLL